MNPTAATLINVLNCPTCYWHRGKELNLSSNALQGTVPATLGVLNGLQRIDLSGNQLSGVLALPVAAIGARAEECQLQDNKGLCVPRTGPYQELDTNSSCGLAL